MLQSFVISQKPTILFGEGTSLQIGTKIKEQGCSKTIVICDPLVRKLGKLEGVFAALQDAGIETIVFDDVIPEPPVSTVHKAAEMAISANVDSILGIGGGSSMDTAKGVNDLIHSEFPLVRYLSCNPGGPEKPNPGVPLFLMPTNSGTGSEVTKAAVFTNDADGAKVGITIPNHCATLAVIDPLFTRGLSPELTMRSALDTMAHCLETITTNVRTPMSQTLGLKGIELVWNNLAAALADDMAARTNLSFAGLVAGMAFCDATCHIGHNFAHTIGGRFHIPHGESCGIVLPYIMEYVAQFLPEELKMIAKVIGVDPASATLGADVREALVSFGRKAGLRTVSQWNVEREALLALVPALCAYDKKGRFTPDEVRVHISPDDYTHILEQLLEV